MKKFSRLSRHECEHDEAVVELATMTYGLSKESAQLWLMKDRPNEHSRYVALDGDERVVGYVTLLRPRPTFARWFAEHGGGSSSTFEVARLMVSPDVRRSGVGSALVSHATQVALDLNMEPAALVLEGNVASKKLMNSQGFVKTGSFEGLDGTNLVFQLLALPSSTRETV